MKADDNRKVTLYLHERGQRWPAVLKPKVDFMHRVADKDGIKEACVGRDASRAGEARAGTPGERVVASGSIYFKSRSFSRNCITCLCSARVCQNPCVLFLLLFCKDLMGFIKGSPNRRALYPAVPSWQRGAPTVCVWDFVFWKGTRLENARLAHCHN